MPCGADLAGDADIEGATAELTAGPKRGSAGDAQ